jgi:hypothetical protein
LIGPKKEIMTHFHWDLEVADRQEQEFHHSKTMNELSIIILNISSKTNRQKRKRKREM